MRRSLRRAAQVATGSAVGAVVVALAVSRGPGDPDGPPGEPGLRFVRVYGGCVSAPRGPIRFSADGRRLVVTAYNVTQTWDLATTRSVEVVPFPPGAPIAPGVNANEPVRSPDGSLLAITGTGTARGTVFLHDARTGADLAALDHRPGAVCALAFSPDGRTLAVAYEGPGSGGGEVVLWDVRSRRVLDVLGGHDGPVYSAVYTRDGKTILSSGNDGRALVWDAATGRRRAVWPGGGGRSLAVGPDGRTVVTAAAVWDLPTGQRRFGLNPPVPEGRAARTGRYDPWVLGVALAPDGRWLVAAGPGTEATIRDTVTGQVVRPLRGHGSFVHTAAVSADGKTVVTAGGGTYRRPDPIDRLFLANERAEVWVWDAETGEGRALAPAPVVVGPVAVSPDGGRLAVAGEGNTLELRAVADGRVTATFDPPAGTGKLGTLAFSPDGTLIAAGGSRPASTSEPWPKGLVWLWDAATGGVVATAETGDTGAVNGVSWRADGRRLLGAASDRAVYLWRVR